ncbi:cobaltochelatase subunit CobN [Lutispora thermophila]|uniref:Cobaltochelatase CobN n=1 Tax=Lutispora thermophila DSM 19022 TaxID=1122184 RepID=A0A1M6H8Z0_9FIRM|nr:cobaltochelatase subunit CobN [Lutispora thermophila]SHJ18670.1 cobaltochelatase CobN [Lutispora thermophila DSM 19022]
MNKSDIYDGIFHPEADIIFDSSESYMKWYEKHKKTDNGPWIGLLIHQNNWLKDNILVEKVLIEEFERAGINVIPAFSYSTFESKKGIKDFNSVIKDYFSIEGRLVIDGLVNFQMLTAIGNGKSGSSFHNGVEIFKQMDIPVFRPVTSYFQSQKEWRENKRGLSCEISWAFTTSEMMGMIEPIIVGCRNDVGFTEPIMERINRFVKRVSKWLELRQLKNSEKKLVLMIHSAPCSGVEATVGIGVGLDVFESVVKILKELKNNGYRVGKIPDTGQELYEIIMKRKAYQDFRWTTVESIVDAGGAIYCMPMEGKQGYMQFYDRFDEKMKQKLEETWGTVPGEGMVLNGEIIISGLAFENVAIMLQPKRGCYGSKCTGEVCKILHDPQCPPPHQYIATYRYIEEIMKANAVIHVGTGGSLEYLPGKANALSSDCWPDLVLGNLPNIYIYNAGIGVEGTGAKRRSSAIILDYMPSSLAVDMDKIKLAKLIGEYLEAEEVNNDQADLMKKEIENMAQAIPKAKEIINSEQNFLDGAKKLKGLLVQSVNNNREQKLHIFGEVPMIKEAAAYIKESIDGSSKNASKMRKVCKDEYEYNVLMMELIYQCIEGNEIDSPYINQIPTEVLDDIKIEIFETYESLKQVKNEIKSIIRALDGKFVEPGLSGIPGDDLRCILPTGRNFYIMNIEKIPTREAYMIGAKLAEQLIERYVKEEGTLPEKIAMNMISTDISRTKGEQLSMMMNLMGIRPVWNDNGKVEGLEEIPLDELKRPRIDVVVRISGVLRDAYPEAVNLMDQAVIFASSLDEPLDKNYVRRNTLKIAEALKMAEADNIERRSTIRIFGDKPGAYGAGVDLALKASAWKKEEDIAKIFTAFSGYAYGNNLNGRIANHEFIENVKDANLSYEATISRRYDILSSGFAASVEGGFKTVKEMFSDKEIKQYHGNTADKDNILVSGIKDEIEKIMEETFFNPLWNESIKERNYTGAAELMRRIQNIFDWECLSENIDDKNIDRIVDTYANDEKMREWFNQHNKYAIEEICRRFLELHERGKWKPNPEVLKKLQSIYMQIEGDMEELHENIKGEYQGGEIEILNQDDIKEWNDKLKDLNEIFHMISTDTERENTL